MKLSIMLRQRLHATEIECLDYDLKQSANGMHRLEINIDGKKFAIYNWNEVEYYEVTK